MIPTNGLNPALQFRRNRYRRLGLAATSLRILLAILNNPVSRGLKFKPLASQQDLRGVLAHVFQGSDGISQFSELGHRHVLVGLAFSLIGNHRRQLGIHAPFPLALQPLSQSLPRPSLVGTDRRQVKSLQNPLNLIRVIRPHLFAVFGSQYTPEIHNRLFNFSLGLQRLGRHLIVIGLCPLCTDGDGCRVGLWICRTEGV